MHVTNYFSDWISKIATLFHGLDYQVQQKHCHLQAMQEISDNSMMTCADRLYPHSSSKVKWWGFRMALFSYCLQRIIYTENMAGVIQSNKIAVISGAASGVGFAVAKLCRSKGMHLALLDIDQGNLAKAKDMLVGINSSLRTEAYSIDVADGGAWKKTAQAIKGVFPDVDLVVLNAGKSYQPQGQDAGRLKPWRDVNYWQKVGDGSLKEAGTELIFADT